MSAKIKILKDILGNQLFPVTKSKCVYTDDNKVIDEIFKETIKSMGDLNETQDLNDYVSPSIYTCTNCINSPKGSKFGLLTVKSSGIYYAIQSYYDVQFYKTYIRYSADSSNKIWTAWQELANTNMLYNPNILHNWDFTNAINQREKTSYSERGYMIDRWKITINPGSRTITTNSNGLVVSQGNSIIEFNQLIENKNVAGNTFTLTVKTSDKIYTGTGIMPLEGQSSLTIIPNNTLFCFLNFTSGDYPSVRIVINPSSSDITFKSIKLEKGTQSTLLSDPPSDYGTELAKCQRYYELLGVGLIGHAVSDTAIMVTVPFKVIKRIPPTLIPLKTEIWIIRVNNAIKSSNSNISIADTDTVQGYGGVLIDGFTGLTVGEKVYVKTENIFAVSAEL